jgi:hypothetical protein
MAAFDPRALQRISTNLLPGGKKVHWFTYATNDTLSEVTTDGYFNAAREALTKSSVILTMVDVDGTPNLVSLKVTTWSASADIVTAADTPAS